MLSTLAATFRRPVLIPMALGVLVELARPTASHAQYTVDWNQQPGGVSVAVDPVGNVFSVRHDYNPAGDIYLAKRSPAGATQWE